MKSILRATLLAGVSAFAISQSAMAQYAWTGFYAGVHGGYISGGWDGKLETTAGNPANNFAGFNNPFHSIDGNAALAGGQIGYNKQIGSVVLGVEADASWAGLKGSGTWATDAAGYNNNWVKEHNLQLDYFGTVRARAGYAMGGFLPYVTGGLAYGSANGHLGVTYVPAGKTSYASVTEDHVGWTIGGGVETMIGGNWSVKAEYLHVDLGEQPYLFKGTVYNGDPFNTDSFKSSLAFEVARVGLNYRIPSGYEPLK